MPSAAKEADVRVSKVNRTSPSQPVASTVTYVATAVSLVVTVGFRGSVIDEEATVVALTR